jgi:voltage-gated potassium channel
MRGRFARMLEFPVVRRVAWYFRQISARLDGGFFRPLLIGLVVFLAVTSTLVWLFETDRSGYALGQSVYWTSTTVLGQGDGSFATGPVGWVAGWVLGLFGVAIVATMTGVLVGFFIDFLLKEGQGMGASGYRDHVVVCGWNPTARDLIDELTGDESGLRIALVNDAERNPAGGQVYYVRGDTTDEADLRRAGIETAKSAIVCPADASNEADLHSILTVLAIEAIAPHVRTVAEVNNPIHVPHFRRANVDELLVTSRITSRLLARSAVYPGLTELVTDMVGGGSDCEDPQLYRVKLPAGCVGMSTIELATVMRADHHANVLAVSRDGKTVGNPPHGFRMEPTDDLVVLAFSLGDLEPVEDAGKVATEGAEPEPSASPVSGAEPATA